MATGDLEWSPAPTTRLGRAALYAPLAPLGGSVVLGAGLLLSIPVIAILRGDLGTALLGVVLLFVGGVGSILYLWVIVRYGENNRQWIEPWIPVDDLDGRALAVTSLVGAAAIVIAVVIEPLLLYVVLLSIPLAPAFGWWLLTRYELDGARRRLTVEPFHPFREPSTIQLDDVASYRRLPGSVRGFRVFLCRRVRGGPFVVPVPETSVDSFVRVLRRGTRSGAVGTPKTASTTRGVRIALYVTGLVLVAPGVIVGVSVGASAEGVLLMAVAFGFYGAIPFGYALLESVRARRDRERGDEDGEGSEEKNDGDGTGPGSDETTHSSTR